MRIRVLKYNFKKKIDNLKMSLKNTVLFTGHDAE